MARGSEPCAPAVPHSPETYFSFVSVTNFCWRRPEVLGKLLKLNFLVESRTRKLPGKMLITFGRSGYARTVSYGNPLRWRGPRILLMKAIYLRLLWAVEEICTCYEMQFVERIQLRYCWPGRTRTISYSKIVAFGRVKFILGTTGSGRETWWFLNRLQL